MVMGAEHRSKCSPSAAMVTSAYEWKILEWDDKLQTNQKKPIFIQMNWVINKSLFYVDYIYKEQWLW